MYASRHAYMHAHVLLDYMKLYAHSTYNTQHQHQHQHVICTEKTLLGWFEPSSWLDHLETSNTKTIICRIFASGIQSWIDLLLCLRSV